MQNRLVELLRKQRTTIQIWGQPGTYKTTLLLQVIRQMIKKGARVYLLDISGNFPIVRLQLQKHLLEKVVVFHPKTIEEEALALDDLAITRIPPNSVLLIDDIFRKAHRKSPEQGYFPSLILTLIKNLAKTLKFPVLITNQARGSIETDSVYPLFHKLVLNYLDWHVLFEKEKGSSILQVTIFEKDQYLSQQEYSIDPSGLIKGIDF
ncbi:MAG: hypothetical protein ACFFE8_12450 [Candidatus Heimdallarchaeota archaeon]